MWFPRVSTTRIALSDKVSTTLRVCGKSSGIPLVLLHGHPGSSMLYSHLMQRLPPNIYSVTYDFRGFGGYSGPPLDATKGLADLADDLNTVMDKVGLEKAHVFGWSFGTGIIQAFLKKYSRRVLSASLAAPIPPYGMCGSKDLIGTPCFSDFAGSGARVVHPEFLEVLKNKDIANTSIFSIKNAFPGVVWNPPDMPHGVLEEIYLNEIANSKVGPEFYPGDWVESPNYPGYAPGSKGTLNSICPKYFDSRPILDLPQKPEILWIRGSRDSLVSDGSIFCAGYLGRRRIVKGWPGNTVFPAQPMIAQTRNFLEIYSQRGGKYKEAVIDSDHSIHLEKEDELMRVLIQHLERFPHS